LIGSDGAALGGVLDKVHTNIDVVAAVDGIGRVSIKKAGGTNNRQDCQVGIHASSIRMYAISRYLCANASHYIGFNI
jgi:hypothetical protein